ncbi:papain-like cysteine protease family protein [Hyalangium rubrum]|uniref:Papain-like cysteine protease family protein n=1 Tax=Hyalangium rubrum TaxID=3103134 RepID=A0ABU5H1P8_9BACT|nr:papain-like cysteine protease family protein [Hyalangium sp. s54d21]MDY7227375.1 papain-like cysteine protease family protein [Hyalangium sp. s54d21]
MTFVNSSRKAGPVSSSSPAQSQQTSAPKQEAQRSSTSRTPPFQRDTFESKQETILYQTKYITLSKVGESPKVPDGTLDLKNRAGPKQLAEGGWEQTTPLLKQAQADTCGAAVAAMLGGSKNHKKLQRPEQYMLRLANRTSDGNQGTTPQELAKMLASQGVEVTGSTQGFNPALARSTLLEKGGKVVALVDSKTLAPKGSEGVKGAAHWVVIDGIDQDGNFLVKDPASGQSEYLPPGRLVQAAKACWAEHGGGGMMTLKNSPQASQGALEQTNAQYAETLGKSPGGGSPGEERAGREANN